MPRRHRLGEAVDDHQVSLAQRLARAGLVTVVETGEELQRAVASTLLPAAVVRQYAGADALVGEVRSALEALGAQPIAAA
jgi:UDP-N-acetylglucosamine transferase subunit ALG13